MGPTGEYAILQVHPARRCNLRCLHCYSRSGPDVDEALGLDLLARAVAEARDLGYGVLGVSGGEPLLYRPLPDLLCAARDAGMRTTVTSNGMLLTERRLAELAGLVDVLALSLDGTPETHVAMRQDPRAFRDLERRLPALRDSGIPFGFIVTLTQHNVHELAWVADFAARAGAGLLQVHPLEPEGYAADALAGSVPDPTELAYAFVESLRLGGSTDAARRRRSTGSSTGRTVTDPCDKKSRISPPTPRKRSGTPPRRVRGRRRPRRTTPPPRTPARARPAAPRPHRPPP
jgi:MoaA/NifB/PqqE/SkfB family radical SAM enzyme